MNHIAIIYFTHIDITYYAIRILIESKVLFNRLIDVREQLLILYTSTLQTISCILVPSLTLLRWTKSLSAPWNPDAVADAFPPQSSTSSTS